MKDLIVGLVLLVLGAWGMISWWDDFGEFLRGVIPLLFVLVGLAALGAGLRKTIQESGHEDEDSDEPSADITRAPGRSD